jgi:predicted ATPase/DNA-binding SARP family transcriptional activator
VTAPASRPATPPVPLTPLVGREREIAELLDLLETTRLLTLTGAGGSGKTRLALEVLARRAASHRSAGPDPATAWVELAAISDAAHVPQQIARTLGVEEEIEGRDPAAALPFIPPGPFLLVLDNCEHLVDVCAEAAEAFLAARPELTILATSREALGITGERAWLVPGLAVPGPDEPLETMVRTEALRLFEERARDVSREFALTPANATVVAEICRSLDGIPLAIELAAARARVLSVEQIRDRLNDALALLTSGGRRVVPRHRTLRAAIDWSHDLLPDPARRLLMRLSVFRGGFTLDGAAAIGSDPGEDPLQVLDQVALLVERSLLQVKEVHGLARYAPLETIRQYAAMRLEASGEAERIRERHARFIASEVARVTPRMTRADRQVHVSLLQADHENIREALAWSRTGAPDLHIEMVGGLWWFWFFTRHWKEAGSWIRGGLALPEAAVPVRGRVRLLLAAGALATVAGRAEEGRTFLEEAVRLAGETEDAFAAAMAQNYLALGYGQVGDPRIAAHAARALAWFERHPEESGHRLALLMSALAAGIEGDWERADRMSLEAVRVARNFGPGDRAASLQNWSMLWALRGDLARAERLVLASLAELRKEHSYMFIARGFGFMGEVAGLRDAPLEGARLLGVAHGIRESIAVRPFGTDIARLARVEPRLREAVGDAAFEAAFARGAGLRWESVLDELLEGWEEESLDAVVAAAMGSEAEFTEVPTPAPPAPSLPEAVSVGGTPGAAETAASAPALRIRTLGGFELEGEMVEAGTWSYVRPRELLLLLLLNPRGVTRQEIGDAIWPDATSAQVKNSYHVTLHHLRKRLGDPAWIVLSGDRYRLARERGIEWDAERFEVEMRSLLRAPDAPDPERLERALASYRGPLLDGTGDARWLEDARDRYRRLHLEGLVLLAQTRESRGEGEAALEAWGRVVAAEELNEEGHRGLMRGWARSGARDRALRHYDRLRILLKEALEAEPEEETRSLHAELASGRR